MNEAELALMRRIVDQRGVDALSDGERSRLAAANAIALMELVPLVMKSLWPPFTWLAPLAELSGSRQSGGGT